MEDLFIIKYIDHTQLKAVATWEEITVLCEEAIEYKTASVCIPPCYVKRVHDTYGENIRICTVIGFPLGYNVKEVKVVETKQAIFDGADEIDMVINLTDIKNGMYDKVQEEIKEIKEAVGDKLLKVIIEVCYLTEDEKIRLCEIVTNAKADYIKTSTGFGISGATIDDVRLMKEHIGNDVKIKAAGGIRNLEDMKAYINEGCSRVGASAAIQCIKGQALSGDKRDY